MANIIAFAHHKGGTGKTTSCTNVAGFLSKMGKDVLVVDLDPQGNATTGLGVDKSALDSTMYEVMVGETGIKEIILKSDSGVHIAPSNLDLMGAELHLYRTNDRTGVFGERVKSVEDNYDYIMVDTPPGSGLFLINGVAASNHVIVPIDPSIFSMESIDTLNTIFGDIKDHMDYEVDPIMALLTRCNRPSWFARLLGKTDPVEEAKANLKNRFGNVFTIPYDVNIYESQQEGIPISHYAPGSDAGRAYEKISNFIAKRVE